MKWNNAKLVLALSTAMGLSACGGGGDGGDGNSNKTGDGADGDVTFNLTGAVSVVTTDEAATVTKAKTQSGHTLPKLSVVDTKTNTKADDSIAATNLFSMDEHGNLQPAYESPYPAYISYTVLSPDGKYLYAMIDSDKAWQSDQLLRNTQCAIFKIDTQRNDWHCLIQGHIVENPANYWGDVNDGRFKPLQLDENGNVYFLSRTFSVKVIDHGDYIENNLDMTYDGSAPLVRVSPEGTLQTLTTDTSYISSFIVTEAGSLVYRAEKLKMIPDLTAKNLSTVDLENNEWSSGWYTIDDHNTVIYSQNNNSDTIQFAQPSSQHIGGIEKRSVNSYDTNVSSNLTSVITGDDGYFYGTYTSTTYDDDGNATSYAKLQRLLPYAPGEIVTVRLPDGYWRNQKIQVSKGYVYYIEEQNNLNFGNRDIIGITRIIDGETKQHLANADWSSMRYSIESWKLVGDVIFFTGFDKVRSNMISGELDTKLFREGKDETEYLTINQAASVYNTALAINDMEVLRPVRPDNSGGNPKVIGITHSDEDTYSSTLEFNKWMDPDSVNQALSVSELDNAKNEVAPVDTMTVWLGRMAHLIYDTSNDSTTANEPLKFATPYRVFIDKDAQDSEGFTLISAQPNDIDRTHDWTVRPEAGMQVGPDTYSSTLTDGNILRYFNGSLSVIALKDIENFDHKVSFTTTLSNEFEIYLHEDDLYNRDILSLRYYPGSKTFYWDHLGKGHTVALSSRLVKITIRLFEADGEINLSLTITGSNDESETFESSVGKVNNSTYHLRFDSSVSGFSSGFMDNLAVTENPDSETPTEILSESFDNVPTSDDNPFTFTESNQ